MSALSGLLPPLILELGAESHKLSAGLAKAKGEIAGFTGQTGSKIGLVAKGFGVVGLAAAAAAAVTTKMAGDYQEKLTTLVTGAGEAQSNLATVGNGLIDMSGQVGVSANQLADGMYMVESAGFHGAAGLQVMKAAAEGAKVGGADMATVANAVTSGLNAYGKSGADAASMTNALIATTASGKMHMEDLAGALGMVLPSAAALHVPIEQVGGALATMTMQGTPAADAATYLRFTMMSLANPTSKAAGELAKVGLTSGQVTDALTHQGLPAALQMITDHIGKKFPAGSAEYTAALADIVGGTRGMQAALELTGPHLQTFQNNVAGIAGKVQDGGDKIAGWGEVSADFNTKLAQLGSGLEGLGIKIGTALLPGATKVLDWLLKLPQVMSDAGAKIGPAIAPAIQTVKDFWDGLTGKSKTGAGADFRSWVQTQLVPALQGVGKAFGKLWDDVRPILTQLGQTAGKWLTDNWPTIKDILGKIGGLTVDVFNLIGSVVGYIGPLIKSFWDQYGQGILSTLRDTFSMAAKVISGALDIIRGIVQVASGLLSGDWRKTWDGIKLIVHGFMEGLRGDLDGFTKIWNDAWDQVGHQLENVWRNNIKPTLDTISGAIHGLTQGGLVGGVTSILHSMGIPGFDKGGEVPGRPGEPSLIVAHGGEYVLSADMRAGRAPATGAMTGGSSTPAGSPVAGPGGSSAPVVNVNVTTNASARQIAAEVGWQLRLAM